MASYLVKHRGNFNVTFLLYAYTGEHNTNKWNALSVGPYSES